VAKELLDEVKMLKNKVTVSVKRVHNQAEAMVHVQERLRLAKIKDCEKEITGLEKESIIDKDVNSQTTKYLERRKTELDAEYAHWRQKYDTDYGDQCRIYDELEARYTKDHNTLEQLRKRLKAYDDEKDAREKNSHDSEQRQQNHARMMAVLTAAVSLQLRFGDSVLILWVCWANTATENSLLLANVQTSQRESLGLEEEEETCFQRF